MNVTRVGSRNTQRNPTKPNKIQEKNHLVGLKNKKVERTEILSCRSGTQGRSEGRAVFRGKEEEVELKN